MAPAISHGGGDASPSDPDASHGSAHELRTVSGLQQNDEQNNEQEEIMVADEPIVMSVIEYFEMKDLESGYFPVTVAVRNQLAELLRAAPGPQVDALFRAIMTTVMNLELAMINADSGLVRVRTNAMEVHTRLLDLETRILESGLQLGPSDYPEPIEWNTED